jgi:hypothetical protein
LLAPRSSMAGLLSALMAGDGRCGPRHSISLLSACRSFACNDLLCLFCSRYNSGAEHGLAAHLALREEAP